MIVAKRPRGARLFFTLRGSLLGVAVTAANGFLYHWKVTLTPVPFSLIGLALAIFLGFRNAAAYERCWEGQEGDKVFGKLRFHGYHRRELFGVPPTGRHVWWYGAPIFTFRTQVKCW